MGRHRVRAGKEAFHLRTGPLSMQEGKALSCFMLSSLAVAIIREGEDVTGKGSSNGQAVRQVVRVRLSPNWLTQWLVHQLAD